MLERVKTEYVPAWEYGTAMAYVTKCENVPETEEFVVCGYRVGPWGMLAMPGEMYTAVGRAIKHGSPFAHTIPVELANGHHGYVIPDHVRENGSYEGRFSSGTTGFGAPEAIVAGAIEILKHLTKTVRCLPPFLLLFYKKSFDVFLRFGIGNGFVDLGNLEAGAQRLDLFVQCGVRLKELKVNADVAHGVLREADDVQCLEGNELGLNGDLARGPWRADPPL